MGNFGGWPFFGVGGWEGGLRVRLCKMEGVKKQRELNENIKMGNRREMRRIKERWGGRR